MAEYQIDREGASKFLDALFGGSRSGLVEYKLLGAKGEPAIRDFIAPDAAWPWDAWQHGQSQGRNVYVGVCPRRVPEGTKGAVGSVPALWIDVDAKQHGDSKDEALAAMADLCELLPPSALVDSGHGYHAYWFLDAPLENEGDDFDDEIGYVEGLNRGLKSRSGGDAVWSIEHVMRVPGTWNLKDASAPVQCRLQEFHPERRYPLARFNEFHVASSRSTEYMTTGTLPDVPLELPGSVTVSDHIRALCNGDLGAVHGDRSRALFRIAQALINAGMTQEAAAAHTKAIDAGVSGFGKYVGRADDTEYHRIARKAGSASNRDRIFAAAKAAPDGRKGEAVAAAVRDLLKSTGRFISYGGDAYFLSNGRLCEIDARSVDLAVLLRRFGISAASQQFKFVVAELCAESRENGTPVEPRSFAYYDEHKQAVYVSTNGPTLLRIDEHAIARIENGADGVVFKSYDDVQPLPADLPPGRAGLLDELIFDRASLDDTTMTADEQRLLLKVWFFQLFFHEALPTRALLLLVGEKGSAKTTVLNLVGHLLVGPDFNVGAVPKSADDFDVIMHRSWLAAFDNVDAHVPWLMDKLAVAATGNAPSKRTYYTTKDMSSMPYRAFVAMTSREPKMARDDVADRTIVLNSKTLEQKSPAWTIYRAVDRERPALFREVVETLKSIVREMRTVGDEVDLNLRLADFGRVGVAVSRALGREDDFRMAVTKLERAQRRFVFENDTLASYLVEFAQGRHGPWEGSASELYQSLQDKPGFTNCARTPLALGKRLARLQPALEGVVDLKVVKTARTHAATYKIASLSDPVELVGSATTEGIDFD